MNERGRSFYGWQLGILAVAFFTIALLFAIQFRKSGEAPVLICAGLFFVGFFKALGQMRHQRVEVWKGGLATAISPKVRKVFKWDEIQEVVLLKEFSARADYEMAPIAYVPKDVASQRRFQEAVENVAPITHPIRNIIVELNLSKRPKR